MAKKSYFGINNTAKKIKNFYIGVNGTARKIKKMYIGITGIARQIFGGEKVSYCGSANLTYKINNVRTGIGRGSLGEYSIFAGGMKGSAMFQEAVTAVDCFNSNLTKTTLNMVSGISEMNVASSQNKLYLTGGTTGNDGRGDNTYTYCVNKSLTLNQNNNSVTRYRCLTTSFNNKAIFAGGFRMLPKTSLPETYTQIYTFDDSGTMSIPTNLTTAVANTEATTIGQYILFGGGEFDSDNPNTAIAVNNMQAFNKSWTAINVSDLSVKRQAAIVVNTDSYALFACGTNGNLPAVYYQTIETYNSSLTRSTAPSTTNVYCDGASCNNIVLIGSGRPASGGSTATTQLDMYDNSLTKTIFNGLSVAKIGMVSIGTSKQIIFCIDQLIDAINIE